MNIVLKALLLLLFLSIGGCGGSDCMNSTGPNAGQCKHYPDKAGCAQVSPYHQTCSLEK